MTTVSRPNRDALNRAVDILRDAMRPFIVRCLRSLPRMSVEDLIYAALPSHSAEQFRTNLRARGSVEAAIDINDFPHLVQRYWQDAFIQQFNRDRTACNNLWLIVRGRNEASHADTRDMELPEAITHLTHIADVLGQINSPNERRLVEEIRDGLLSTPGVRDSSLVTDRLEESPRGPAEPTSVVASQTSRSAGSLKPWREVLRPNADVALGLFREAEFVADLQQVYDGRANENEYGNPVSFFDNTYITPGLRTLLLNAMKRVMGNGGDPVIQTKTGFGGGKTHSLIALYHLVSSTEAILNPAESGSTESSEEVGRIVQEAGMDPASDVPKASVSVLDGTFLATTDPTTTEQGDPLNTLWGVMAYQLGGQEAYEIIGQAARERTAPGGAQLDSLFGHVGPCVILMDELVAYVRNAGGAQDSIYTFIQNLTQAARRASNVALIVTLPEHAVEAGGEQGLDALARLDNIFGRIQTVWEPLEVNEAFEVVRRRLFGARIDEVERDRTCERFSRMYGQARGEYPQGVAESRYLERMKDCYPIHPEIFDRLYSDWSSIPRFQRTRGVLRMMANCVGRLYLNNDLSPLIMPGALTLDDPSLANEFLDLLGDQWRAVLTEVDSNGSRTDDIDRSSQRFANVGGASRRIARTILLGSAPSGAIRGIDERQIRLGVVEPSQGVSVYNEARNRMVDDLYYLYVSDGRYYFNAEENLNKVATDRASALTTSEVDDFIRQQVEDAVGSRQDVVIWPDQPSGVSDTDSTRVVILPPSNSINSRSSETDNATPEALRLLSDHRGSGDRVNRNSLLFLAARRDEVRNLASRARVCLAWDSIMNGERRIENLQDDRQRQAVESIRQAKQNFRTALVAAYRWAMAPVQDNPQDAVYRLSVAQTDASDTGDIVGMALAKFVEDEALADVMSPSSLANILQQHIWSNEQYRDHIGIDILWRMVSSQVYMQRLRDSSVLAACVESGVSDGTFGFADSYDPESSTDPYPGLRFREPISLLSEMSERSDGLLVNAEMADFVQTERRQQGDDVPTQPDPPEPPELPETPPQQVLREIVVSKTVQDDIDLNDISLLREEIIRNLNDDGGDITVNITISARKPQGFTESITRAVRQNSIQLGLNFQDDVC